MLVSCNHIKKLKKKKMLGSCKGFFFLVVKIPFMNEKDF